MHDEFKKQQVLKIFQRSFVEEKHTQKLKSLRDKKKIRVVFLVVNKAIWKFDSLYRKMLADKELDPIILVCPYTYYGEERLHQELKSSFDFFKNKKFKVYNALQKNGSWLDLSELAPDIVFFTYPHPATLDQYYDNVYKNYLTCYAGYGLIPVLYFNGLSQYNHVLHNFLWKTFVHEKIFYDKYTEGGYVKNRSIHIAGDSNVEYLLEKRNDSRKNVAWQNAKPGMKNIIWAPHHTITEDWLPLSTFLDYHNFFKKITEQTKDKIFWSFKPHPVLKEKLYNHPEWGVKRTDAYYKFWEEGENTQYDEGDYKDLFTESDALILCSATFMAEYLYIDKPMLFTLNNRGAESFFNELGHDCISAMEVAKNEEHIHQFIASVLAGEDGKKEARKKVLLKYPEIYNPELPPSDKMIQSIKETINSYQIISTQLPKSKQPLVSVCLVTDNHGAYIDQVLDSIAAQNYHNLEVIIADNASSDATLAKLEKLHSKFILKITTSNEKRSFPELANQAIATANGEFVVIIEPTDTMQAGRLNHQVQYMLEHPNHAAVLTDISVTNQEGQAFEGSEQIEKHFNLNIYNFRKQLIGGNFANTSSAMIRRESLLKTKGFTPSLKYMIDYDLWGRLIEQGDITKIPIALTTCGVHSHSRLFGLASSSLPEAQAELIKTVSHLVRLWPLQAISQLCAMTPNQRLENLLGLASLLQLLDAFYLQKPAEGTSLAYELIEQASLINTERAALAKQSVQQILNKGFNSTNELFTDEVIKWFGDVLLRLE